MPAGEENKNIHVLEGVYNELCDFNLSRDDAIVTFSGGVPGDLGGFAAASYMRGVPFFQVPTTILAQIDSSVGGRSSTFPAARIWRVLSTSQRVSSSTPTSSIRFPRATSMTASQKP